MGLPGKVTEASVYDPYLGGINGSPNRGGCGIPSGRLPWSVAHKTLPCGTVVTIVLEADDGTPSGIVQVPVADRGPYIRGRDLDLRPDVAKALGLNGLGKVRYSVGKTRINISKYADLGGNAEAFKKVTVSKDHPNGLQPTSAGFINKSDPDSPTGIGPIDDVLTAPGDAVQAIGSAADTAINGVGDFISFITDPDTWLRLGKGALGFTFIVVGTGALVYVVGNKVKGTALAEGVAAVKK